MIEVERVITEMYGGIPYQTLQGGISKSSHKLELPNNSNTVVVTIFENPDDWWKIEKDRAIDSCLIDTEVLHAKVLDSCFLDTGPNDKIAVLIR